MCRQGAWVCCRCLRVLHERVGHERFVVERGGGGDGTLRCIVYDWIITIVGYSKHELQQNKHGVLPKKICHITLLPPHNGQLSTTATFFCFLRFDCNKNLVFAGFWWVGLACKRPTGSILGCEILSF